MDIDLFSILSKDHRHAMDRKIDYDKNNINIVKSLATLCSPLIRGKSKDLYDLYLVAINEEYTFNLLATCLREDQEYRKIKLGKLGLLNYEIVNGLSNSYRKYKLFGMPSFDEVCGVVLSFVLPLIDGIQGVELNTTWSPKYKCWSNNVILGNRVNTDLTGIIYGESASGILGMSTFPSYPVLVRNHKVDVKMQWVWFTTKNYDLNYTEKIREDLYITTPSRTVVDLAIDGEFRIFEESYESYIEDGGTKEELFNIAKDYIDIKKFTEILEDVEQGTEYI